MKFHTKRSKKSFPGVILYDFSYKMFDQGVFLWQTGRIFIQNDRVLLARGDGGRAGPRSCCGKPDCRGARSFSAAGLDRRDVHPFLAADT
jgi:hypothetical protein